jgi:hypothetical protein
VLIYLEPGALFWVQNAHSLQYLMFPMRVELNRAQAAGHRTTTWHMARYYGIIVAGGLLALWLMPWLARTRGGLLGLANAPLEFTIISFINLHHYFIDGVIWKLRDPEVRRDLFSHLQLPAPARAPAVAVASPAVR